MFYADLHIHSRYSRATSRDCEPAPPGPVGQEERASALVGTGDFTHPAWRARAARAAASRRRRGSTRLKEAYRLPWDSAWPRGSRGFSSRGRSAPSTSRGARPERCTTSSCSPAWRRRKSWPGGWSAIGNLHSDGRPILGLACHDLLEITLETCPQAVFIPAHIWTPHFSLFGAFSGFDTLEECFGDLTPHIRARGDGPLLRPAHELAGCSAPGRRCSWCPTPTPTPPKSWAGRPTCWRPSSPTRPGQACPGDRRGPVGARWSSSPRRASTTWTATGTAACACPPGRPRPWRNLCPVCGKPLTIGVEHRVEDLARRQPGEGPAGAKPFVRLAPLATVLAARLGKGEQTKTVQGVYEALLAQLGPEFTVLRQTPAEAIASLAGEAAAQGVELLRQGKVAWRPGFDGESRQALLPRGVKAKKKGPPAGSPFQGGRMKFIKKSAPSIAGMKLVLSSDRTQYTVWLCPGCERENNTF